MLFGTTVTKELRQFHSRSGITQQPSAFTSTLPEGWSETLTIDLFDGSELKLTIQPADVSSVPEPASMLLLLTGGILLTGRVLQKRLFNS